MLKLFGTYAGTVEDDQDPNQVGRLKVRAPTVYGPSNQGVVTPANQQSNSIPTSDIPWALPVGLPAGGTEESGMITWLPKVGDHVFLRFLDGEPEKPVWEWGTQDLTQAEGYQIWTRDPGGYQGPSAPKSAYLTRYGHGVDFQPGFLRGTTKGGHLADMNDTLQAILIRSAGTNFVRLDDANQLITVQSAGGHFMTFNDPLQTVTLQSSGTQSLEFDDPNNTVTMTSQDLTYLIGKTLTEIQVNRINLGKDADDAVVRLSDLQMVCNVITSWANSHTHTGVQSGGGTSSTTAQPLSVTPTASELSYSI